MNADPKLVTPSQRLFVALWPDDGVRAQLATHANQWHWPAGCRRYDSADWHVTLHFLGAVASGRIDALVAAAAAPVAPFELVLDQPGLWPRGLAVLRASVFPEPLRDLHERLGQALSGFGFALDPRPYVPHVTLARHAEAALAPTACAPVRWQVKRFALVLSTGLAAPRYRVIHSYR